MRFASRKDAKAQRTQRFSENEIARTVVDAAIEIHRDLGPGLLESVYEAILCKVLTNRGLFIQRQARIPVAYRGMRFSEAFRADVIVEHKVLVELKATESLSEVHKRQLLTYLKLTNIRLGLILNFGETLMRQGITRVVNRLKE